MLTLFPPLERFLPAALSRFAFLYFRIGNLGESDFYDPVFTSAPGG